MNTMTESNERTQCIAAVPVSKGRQLKIVDSKRAMSIPAQMIRVDVHLAHQFAIMFTQGHSTVRRNHPARVCTLPRNVRLGLVIRLELPASTVGT